MCGIVGVVGNRNATDILMQGLENWNTVVMTQLEFCNNRKNSSLVKSVGRIADLRSKIGIDVAGSMVIGTRWATHGKPKREQRPSSSL